MKSLYTLNIHVNNFLKMFVLKCEKYFLTSYNTIQALNILQLMINVFLADHELIVVILSHH